MCVCVCLAVVTAGHTVVKSVPLIHFWDVSVRFLGCKEVKKPTGVAVQFEISHKSHMQRRQDERNIE